MARRVHSVLVWSLLVMAFLLVAFLFLAVLFLSLLVTLSALVAALWSEVSRSLCQVLPLLCLLLDWLVVIWCHALLVSAFLALVLSMGASLSLGAICLGCLTRWEL
jgi:hypothetical protein